MINKNNDYKLAFSMVELIVSISIMTVLGLLLTMSITKKTQKVVSSAIGGEFVCYKDVNNRLRQKTTLRYLGGKIQEEDKEVGVCKFEFPESAGNTTVYLVGGGGGGGGLPNEVFHTDGDSDNIQRICDVHDEDGDIAEVRVAENQQIDSRFIPIACEQQSFYHQDRLPACQNGGFSGSVTGVHEFNGQNKYACDEGCKCQNNNVNVAGAAVFNGGGSAIVNHLSDYMNNAAYKTVVLDNFILSMQNGDGTTRNIAPNMSVDDNFACFNGVPQTRINNGVTTISATNGIVQINNNAQTTDAFESVGDNPFQLYYSVKLLHGGSCRLPVGQVGEAGNTQVISSQNLAGRKLTISADKIGDGGAGGQYQQNIQNINPQNIYTSGANGGDTVFELGVVSRRASGGVGGTIGFQEVPLSDYAVGARDFIRETRDWAIAINNQFMWSDNFRYVSSVLNQVEAPISQYVIDNVLDGAVNQDELRAQPAVCQNGTCSAVKLPTDKASYGAAGGATVSMLKYDPLYAMMLYKRINGVSTPIVGRKFDGNNFVYFIYKWPELIKPQEQTNNGSGGAIIFKWGD